LLSEFERTEAIAPPAFLNLRKVCRNQSPTVAKCLSPAILRFMSPAFLPAGLLALMTNSSWAEVVWNSPHSIQLDMLLPSNLRSKMGVAHG
jgi:hypothetical protein